MTVQEWVARVKKVFNLGQEDEESPYWRGYASAISDLEGFLDSDRYSATQTERLQRVVDDAK